MAWTSPMTAVANSVFTAAQFNAMVRDNLNETAPAKATTAGSFFAVTGLNAIAERTPTLGDVSDGQATTSTSFTDLATPGPSIEVVTAVNAVMFISSRLRNQSAGQEAIMGVEVSGASSIAPSSTTALRLESSNAGDWAQMSYAFLRNDLTPGTNVFTAKYSATGGTAEFSNRRLVTIPF